MINNDYNSRREQFTHVPPEGVPRTRQNYGSVASIGYPLTDDESMGPESFLELKAEKEIKTNERPKDLTSNTSTLVNLLKGFLGTGYLGLPQAFKFGGLWFSVAMLPVMACITTHCLHLLLKSSKDLCERYKLSALNYEETVHLSLLSHSSVSRKVAFGVTAMVKVLLVIMQFGFCCSYYQLVVQNIHQFVECHVGAAILTHVAYSAIFIVPFMAVSCIRDLKTITYLSMVSSIIQLASVAIILYYCTRDYVPVMTRPAVGMLEEIPLFFGIVSYAYEGIGLLLPIENKMKNPKHLGGVFGLLNMSLVIISVMFFTIGFYGYLRYGEETRGSITLNLPASETLAMLVKLLMALALLLSFTLQMYVPVQVFLPLIISNEDNDKTIVCKEFFIRAIFVSSTFSLCAAIPNIGVFMSFIGSVSSSSLTLILPPIIHLVTIPIPFNTWRGRLTILKAAFIIAVGVVVSVTGTFTSTRKISAIIKEPPVDDIVPCGEL